MRTRRLYQLGSVSRAPLAVSGRRRHLELVTAGNTFGEMLVQLRRAQRLKQSEAAERAGISENYWGKLERGDSPASAVPVETFKAICNAVGATVRQVYALAQLAGGKLEENVSWAGDVSKSVTGELPRLASILEEHPELRKAQDRVTMLNMLRTILERDELEAASPARGTDEARLLRNEDVPPDVAAGDESGGK